MKITKPDLTNIWAEAGSIAAVDSSKISEGWIVEIPPYEEANFIENRQDEGIAYLMQQGVPEWDSSIEFQASSSYVQYSGVVYKCLITATGKQPDIYPTYWTKAFDDAGAAQAVQSNLDAVTSATDPFTQYLLKSRAIAHGIDTDLLVTNSLVSTNLNILSGDGVWVYDSTCTNRPFINGKISQAISGNTVFQISESADGVVNKGIATRTGLSGVFTEWEYAVTSATPLNISTIQDTLTSLQAQITNLQVKVGDLFTTTIDFLSPTDVTAHLGYGVWQRFGQGQALVGRSALGGAPSWTTVTTSTYGEYTHTLTTDEMPSHTHNSSGSAGTGEGSGSINSVQQSAFSTPTTSTGGGQAHNNVQPSIIIGVWLRTS